MYVYTTKKIKEDIDIIKKTIEVKDIEFDEFQSIYLIQLESGEYAVAGRLDVDFRMDIYISKESLENGDNSVRDIYL